MKGITALIWLIAVVYEAFNVVCTVKDDDTTV
jgi:hypothetical protein